MQLKHEQNTKSKVYWRYKNVSVSCLPWATQGKALFGEFEGHQKTQKAPHCTTGGSRARAHWQGRQSHSHYWPDISWGGGERRGGEGVKKCVSMDNKLHIVAFLTLLLSLTSILHKYFIKWQKKSLVQYSDNSSIYQQLKTVIFSGKLSSTPNAHSREAPDMVLYWTSCMFLWLY